MRIAFFSDTHIDYSYATRTDEHGVNLRVRDGYDALRAIINDIVEHKDQIDVVIMGGDLFHTSHPSIRSIAVVQHYLRELARAGLPIHILAGNHDATDNRAYPAAVAVVDDPERGIFAHYKPYTIATGQQFYLPDGVALHVLSHHGLHKDDAPELDPIDGMLNIFTTHGSAVDPGNKTLMHCLDSPREQIVPPELIASEAFSLKLLGHYHSRAYVGNEALNTWYAGSTLRRGFSDAAGPRGWLEVVVPNDGGQAEVIPHDIKQRPQYDLEVIDAKELSPAEVEEQILAHLAETRNGETGEQFDPKNAPIIRQRVINVPRSLREGIDRRRIADHASHALNWLLEFSRPEHVATSFGAIDTEAAELSPEDILAQASTEVNDSLSIKNVGTVDMVDTYQKWTEESQTLRNLADEKREPVKDSAAEHLRAAQDAEYAS